MADVDTNRDRRGARDRAVPVRLAEAAGVAAVQATWASFVSNDASDSWQAALREEIRRSAATIEDVRYTFTSEGSIAYEVTQARVLEQEFRAEAARRTGAQQAALEAEAATQAKIAEAILPSSEVASDPKYALPEGGFDLIQRLADNRARFPDLAAIDPTVDQTAGDRAATRAVLIVTPGIPVAITLMLGALAKAFGRYRRQLLTAGTVTLAVAVAMALLVAVLA